MNEREAFESWFQGGFGDPECNATAWYTWQAAWKAGQLSTKQEWISREHELQTICAEAYQVVGSLLYDAGLFDTEKGIKIMDNLSQQKLVHTDILPWNIEHEIVDESPRKP